MKGTAVGEVVVVIGAGSIGQAIARRVSAGKHVLLADLRSDLAAAAAKIMSDAGFHVNRSARLSRQPQRWAMFGASFTPPAFRPRRHRPRRSSRSIFTARRLSLR